MERITPIEKQLISMLKDIWNDKDFVIGIITDLETDDERQLVIDYIKNNDGAKPDDLVLLSLHIDNERTKHQAHIMKQLKL